ncbi:PKD domain-containing protein [Paraneptunicella aestuarii]|uniref:LamG-like jellyroll fold domain-containing protein n=1 Tax=Paraneptunicella aestuarii TaxID=2831148 RepID=UPI001E29AC91|nr:LamG-like jellyroll fold domain-containing protein [Paraneptunicella aestuarii]UAA38776.1 PKD domain-containing protein [Paraneptunicella aestuarii]
MKLLLHIIICLPLIIYTHFSFAVQQCAPAPSGLTHWWTGDYSGEDKISGATMTSVSGAGFNTGFVGGAFALDGTNDYFRSPPLLLEQNFTLEAWVNLSPKSTTDWRQNQSIVTQYSGGNGPYIIWEANPNLTWLGFHDGSWAGTGKTFTGGWHHIAVTRDKLEGKKKIYVDGLQASSSNIGRNSPITRPVYIGYAGDYSRFAKGYIDEVSYYNRVLSLEEIQSVYNAGSAGKCTPSNDTVAPVIVNRTINYDAIYTTVSGTVTLDEQGSIEVIVKNESTGDVISTSSTNSSTSEPFTVNFENVLGVPVPQIIRVTLIAKDLAGNTAQEQSILLLTDYTSSSVIEPSSGISLIINGEIVDVSSSLVDGRPVFQLTNNEPVDLVFTISHQQALSLCGQGNTCVVYVNGQPVETSVSTLSNGQVQFTAPYSGTGEVLHVELGFDASYGGSGINQATDPNTGNQFSATGDIVQTTLNSDAIAVITAGSTGGQTEVSFTLSYEQDLLRCAGLPNACVIQENFTTDLVTSRTVLPSGSVKYATSVTLQPYEVKLYSLKVLDVQPPQVGDIFISVPFIRGGEEVTFSISITDNTAIRQILCRYTLPDGTVIETVYPGSDSLSWSFTPPSVGSGYIDIELVVTDIAGNTVVVTPVDAQTGQPASILLDNDAPVIAMTETPIVTSKIFDSMPVADRNECVQLSVFATDATTAVESLTFVITQPNGEEIHIEGLSAQIPGLFTGELCLSTSSQGGLHSVRYDAVDSTGNTISIECESFHVNSAPIVDAGEDAWVAPNEDAAFNGSFTDPDSNDTHTIEWTMGDGNGATGTLTPDYSYSQPGIYIATLVVTDSFGELGSDDRVVYVTGNGMIGDVCREEFWEKQFKGKKHKGKKGKGHWSHKDDDDEDDEDEDEDKEHHKKCKAKEEGVNAISEEELIAYMSLIRAASSFFDELMPLTTIEDGLGILKKANKEHESLRRDAIEQALVAWLNFAHGAIRMGDMVNVDHKRNETDMTFKQAITEIEAVLLNPDASKQELRKVTRMAEWINKG